MPRAKAKRPTRTTRPRMTEYSHKEPERVGEVRQVPMDTIPRCDFCTSPARYDAASMLGPWGYFCERHFDVLGNGRLGVGYGQELVERTSLEKDKQ